jgi:hypothetical protein
MQVADYETARRETGGSFHLAVSSPGEGSDIETRIIGLEALTTADLQIEWRRLYQATPPTRLSRDLLIRGVAYKVQEQAHKSRISTSSSPIQNRENRALAHPRRERGTNRLAASYAG